MFYDERQTGGFALHRVVTSQPRLRIQPLPGQRIPADEWMAIPTGIRNCPPGLEYLTSLDKLLVKQKIDVLELFTPFEISNKYTVKNARGQNVYCAVEVQHWFSCLPCRPFDMKILDVHKNEVINLKHPLSCFQTLKISAPPDNVIGSIEEEPDLRHRFNINNHIGDTVLRIEGPVCACTDSVFNVLSLTGDKIGKISHERQLLREIFTDADFFSINFPMDLDVHMKAVLLGATFLIDMLYYE